MEAKQTVENPGDGEGKPFPTGKLSRSALRQHKREAFYTACFVLLVLAFGAGTWMWSGGVRPQDFSSIWSYAPAAVTMAIGAAVGGIELLGRYRHAPLRALMTASGASYIFINLIASLAAYYMLAEFKVFDSLTEGKELIHVLTAGFSALVFMRSSFFRVRVGDADIGIGPSAILDTVLLVADRGVDRREAVARAKDVTDLVARVKDPRIVAKMLTKYSLSLMQNVDEKTSQELGDAIGKIMDDKDTPDVIKMDIVALRLGVVVGPDVLEAAVEALGDRLSSSTDPNMPSLSVPAKPSVSPTATSGAGAAQSSGSQTIPTPTAEALEAEIQKSLNSNPTSGTN